MYWLLYLRRWLASWADPARPCPHCGTARRHHRDTPPSRYAASCAEGYYWVPCACRSVRPATRTTRRRPQRRAFRALGTTARAGVSETR